MITEGLYQWLHPLQELREDMQRTIFYLEYGHPGFMTWARKSRVAQGSNIALSWGSLLSLYSRLGLETLDRGVVRP